MCWVTCFTATCYNVNCVSPRSGVSMFLSIKQMELREIRFDETFAPGELDFQDDDIQQGGPLRVEGTAELLPNTEGQVRVRGRFEVRMETECDRCLGRAQFPLNSSFDLFYKPVSFIAREEEVGLDEGEVELGFYQGAGMELEDILREQILLLMPMQRVCSEACKGICPSCGKNRNETPCDCKDEHAGARWAALRDLRDLETL